MSPLQERKGHTKEDDHTGPIALPKMRLDVGQVSQESSMTSSAVCQSIPGWFPPPHGIEAIRKTYGDIDVSAGGVILGPSWWESTNMVTVSDLPLWGPRRLYVHKKIEPMLREALRMCSELGGYELKSIGCFNPRRKRTSNSLSLHSWGVAVDINPDDNPPMHIRKPGDLLLRRKTIPDEWIAAWKSCGWTWGGDFSGYWDPCHMQYASGY